MSLCTADIVKPVTQIFNQQPKDIFEIAYNDEMKNKNVLKNKPVAYVLPIEKSNVRDQAIQTDSISIDINSIINIYDFHRSGRLVGQLDNINTKEKPENCELISAETRIKVLEGEINQQLKINDDIKKLLIASLGDDLAAHLLKLTSEVASFNALVTQMMAEKIGFSEDIDKLSIEADLWRNKFVAGRVLVDELAGWKHQLSLRYRESLEAVHCLLQERQSLRQLMSMMNTELLSVSAHLNHRPQSLTLTSSIYLAKYNLILLKSIKSRLSAGALWNSEIAIDEAHLCNLTDLTEGEQLALEVLMNQPNPNADNSARITASFGSESSQCMERIADKLCKNCRGEIFII